MIEPTNPRFLIGQRVLLNNDEIGTVIAPEKGCAPAREGEVWVFAPSKGWASCYSLHNVKPLPNGQL